MIIFDFSSFVFQFQPVFSPKFLYIETDEMILSVQYWDHSIFFVDVHIIVKQLDT